tara:strand:- start:64 stop:1107 length:1044 start_codon:yes stop_codon:yes gene_type:complete
MRLGGTFDVDNKEKEIIEIENQLLDKEIWSDIEKSAGLNKRKTFLEKSLTTYKDSVNKLTDNKLLLDMALEEDDQITIKQISEEILEIKPSIENLEFTKMFSGKMDESNAFVDIQSGSGGTEAQDWADMLLRMYLKWAESKGFSATITESSPGEVAGIKSSSILIEGDYAYGWLRSETGVHRLVRKSPFDSGNRRHTSFASVFISPEINDDIEIEINNADIRVDTYRASGAGGQHVNKTDSAVRLTHIPTGTVSQCQNGRSQHKNKENALKQLKSKLYELELQKQKEEQQKLEDSKADIGWGSQIRSYVLDQSRIKDLRTNFETGNTSAVLDGNIDEFMRASLKAGI